MSDGHYQPVFKKVRNVNHDPEKVNNNRKLMVHSEIVRFHLWVFWKAVMQKCRKIRCSDILIFAPSPSVYNLPLKSHLGNVPQVLSLGKPLLTFRSHENMDFSLNFAQICSWFIPVDRVSVVSIAIVIVSLL